MSGSAKSMREKMPVVTAFIDLMRLEFGEAEINDSIRRMMVEGTFYAIEGEHVVGNPPREALIRCGHLPPDPVAPAVAKKGKAL